MHFEQNGNVTELHERKAAGNVGFYALPNT